MAADYVLQRLLEGARGVGRSAPSATSGTNARFQLRSWHGPRISQLLRISPPSLPLLCFWPRQCADSSIARAATLGYLAYMAAEVIVGLVRAPASLARRPGFPVHLESVLKPSEVSGSLPCHGPWTMPASLSLLFPHAPDRRSISRGTSTRSLAGSITRATTTSWDSCSCAYRLFFPRGPSGSLII